MSIGKPKVSIIIPTYNRYELLKYTLNSILHQVTPEVIETIVVDDGSTDETPSLIDQFRHQLNLKYYYQEDKGARRALARNVGIENATGEICLFVDSGLILSSTFVDEHLKPHALHTEPVSVIGYLYGFDNNTPLDRANLQKLIDVNQPDRTIDAFIASNQYNDPRNRFFLEYADDLSALPAPWVFYWGGNISARRAHILEVGMFDTGYDLNWGMEDLDLGYRLFRNKVKIRLNRKANAIHYPHSKDIDTNTQEHNTNKLFFDRKYNTEETKLFLEHTWELNEVLLNNTCIAQ